MRAGCLEWAVASGVCGGEVESGDRHFVRSRPHGTLVAVVDGLGHGAPASVAAERALDALRQAEDADTMPQVMERCHAMLMGTRGAVISLCIVRPDAGTLEWLGIGNVEGLVVRAVTSNRTPREQLISRSGLVGNCLPALVAASVPLSEGDTLIMATDGIDTDFQTSVVTTGAPQQIADHILATYGRSTDDALVLVARHVAGAGGVA